MKTLLKIVLLSPLELKNVPGCLGKQSMCHQSCCRLVAKGTLGKDVEKTFKMLLWICQVLLNTQMLSKVLNKC
jgi:hypothetical protein